MMALITGGTGMAQREPRLVYAGIAFGVVGVLMRLYLRFKSRGSVAADDSTASSQSGQ
jgi:hypothetical protein